MMDDRFDDFLREAAQEYHRPPEAPREEIWGRIEAARRARAAEATGRPPVDLLERKHQRRFRYRPLLALAAVLMLGVAIGRLSMTRSPAPPVAAPVPVLGAAGEVGATVATKLAAVQHLTRVEALLTDYQSGRPADEIRVMASDLLTRTRLWIDAGVVDDPRLRRLLEDLELMLVQIAQLGPNGQTDERAWIDQGLAERQIRPRLRNAIPTGPSA